RGVPGRAPDAVVGAPTTLSDSGPLAHRCRAVHRLEHLRHSLRDLPEKQVATTQRHVCSPFIGSTRRQSRPTTLSCQSASRGSIGPEASGRADPPTEYTVISLGRASSPL